MRILKFGGTSVGSAERMKSVATLINDGKKKIVVLSAMSGTTNNLVEICDYFYSNNVHGALEKINALAQKYNTLLGDLYAKTESLEKATEIINKHFDYLRTFAKGVFTLFEEKAILAQGEMLSTALFIILLEELNVDARMLPALDFMKTDRNGEPDTAFIKIHLKEVLSTIPTTNIYITQGYICRNVYDEIDNLQRGGSDYTASLIGAAVKADEIQIWTDIDGMHNNDPRFVAGTKPVPNLHFDEAAELAYFGAKILHPTCILPAKLNNIPVRLLNTMNPKAHGTLISNTTHRKGVIEAIAAKDDITVIRITSGRMLLAYGFLRKVFEIFETYQTSIDMITTSEVAVSLTVDNDKKLDEIVNDLKKFGTVSIDKNMVIICVVGDLPYENVGFQAKIVNALKDVPLRMISYGGSKHNVSILVQRDDKTTALRALSRTLFEQEL